MVLVDINRKIVAKIKHNQAITRFKSRNQESKPYYEIRNKEITIILILKSIYYRLMCF